MLTLWVNKDATAHQYSVYTLVRHYVSLSFYYIVVFSFHNDVIAIVRGFAYKTILICIHFHNVKVLYNHSSL